MQGCHKTSLQKVNIHGQVKYSFTFINCTWTKWLKYWNNPHKEGFWFRIHCNVTKFKEPRNPKKKLCWQLMWKGKLNNWNILQTDTGWDMGEICKVINPIGKQTNLKLGRWTGSAGHYFSQHKNERNKIIFFGRRCKTKKRKPSSTQLGSQSRKQITLEAQTSYGK